MTGLTSVTLRTLTPDEILSVCSENRIGQIEWGGDVHVPPEDTMKARQIKEASDRAGVRITSYGSYYRLGEAGHEDLREFTGILETSKALGAPLIRVWAGNRNLSDAEPSYLERVRQDVTAVCRLAAEQGLSVGLEYHRNTLTETMEGTKKLLALADCPNLYTYWQMNPDITHEERLRELEGLSEKLCGIHVFYWKEGNERLPLRDGFLQWQAYMERLKEYEGPFLLEFVRDDSLSQLKEDSLVLHFLLEERGRAAG